MAFSRQKDKSKHSDIIYSSSSDTPAKLYDHVITGDELCSDTRPDILCQISLPVGNSIVKTDDNLDELLSSLNESASLNSSNIGQTPSSMDEYETDVINDVILSSSPDEASDVAGPHSNTKAQESAGVSAESKNAPEVNYDENEIGVTHDITPSQGKETYVTELDKYTTQESVVFARSKSSSENETDALNEFTLSQNENIQVAGLDPNKTKYHIVYDQSKSSSEENNESLESENCNISKRYDHRLLIPQSSKLAEEESKKVSTPEENTVDSIQETESEMNATYSTDQKSSAPRLSGPSLKANDDANVMTKATIKDCAELLESDHNSRPVQKREDNRIRSLCSPCIESKQRDGDCEEQIGHRSMKADIVEKSQLKTNTSIPIIPEYDSRSQKNTLGDSIRSANHHSPIRPIQPYENGSSSQLSKVTSEKIYQESHTLASTHDGTVILCGVRTTCVEAQNDINKNSRLKYFRNNLQCLKSKTIPSLNDNKNHQNTQVVSELPDIKRMNPGDDNVNIETNIEIIQNNIDKTSNTPINNSIATEDDNDKTKQDRSPSDLLKTNYELASSGRAHHSVTASIAQKKTVNEIKLSINSVCFEEEKTESIKSMQLANSETLGNGNDASAADFRCMIMDDGDHFKDITTTLLSYNDEKPLSSATESSRREKDKKDDKSSHEPKNGSKEHPESDTGTALVRFFENISFQRYGDDSRRSWHPSSVSMIDGHKNDRGLSQSPNERQLNDFLIMNNTRLHQNGSELGETNAVFGGETEDTELDNLVQILFDLSKQLKDMRSVPEIQTSGNIAGQSLREIQSVLLENLRLLQNTINFNPEPDVDSMDEEDDDLRAVLVSKGAFRLAGIENGSYLDPEQPMLASIRSNEEDNLSLEFFVPGSTKTFRLHRKTFIAFVLKYSIFMFSFLFWFSSLSVVGFGGWMMATESAIVIDDFTDVFFDPYALLCIVGGIVFFVAFFGCIGALRENICLLRIFHLALTFVLVLELLVGAIVFLFFTLPEFRQAVKVGPEEVLKRAVVEYFDDEGMQRWIDNLQKQFRCCGTSLSDDGYLDWQENEYFNCSSPSVYSCSVPLSCCIFEKGDYIDYMCGADIIRREESYVKRYINTKGCMKSLGEWLADNTTVIAYITAGVVIPQILGVVSARHFNSMLRRLSREVVRQQDIMKPVDNFDQSSSYVEQEEECGFENVNEPEIDAHQIAVSSRRRWRRLSNASKALFQISLRNKLLCDKDEVSAEYNPAKNEESKL